jgi:hypothetical protein
MSIKSITMMPPRSRRADLADNLADGINVGLDDGIFQPRRLADIFPRIDVNRHQRFGLVDHGVAAAFEPHLGFQRFVDLLGDVELLEQRRLFALELHALDEQAGPNGR